MTLDVKCNPNSPGIYAIINIANGKRYVGSAVNLRKRWNTHASALKIGNHANAHLQNAWNKYGPESFQFSVIALCSVGQLLECEQAHINEKSDFNICMTAGNTLGVKPSPEHRAKLVASHTGKPLSLETRAKMSAAHKGNKYSVGRTYSAEERAERSITMKGRTFSPETRAKLSAALTGIKRSPETKAKISAAQCGRIAHNKGIFGVVKLSDETRAKMSEAKRNTSLETKAKMSKTRTGRKLSDETKVKISIAHKKRFTHGETIKGYAFG
jgi:group I intron endonuclease